MRCEASKVYKNITYRDRQLGSGDKVRDGKNKTKNSQINEAAPYPAWSNEPSTSAAYEKTYTEEQTRKLFDQIWSNDLIMSQIIGNVNSLVDRVNLEKASHHFYKLSKKGPWKFSKLKNELNLTYYALDTSIMLEHGNLKFRRPSMTLVDRRERLDDRNKQTRELLATLIGIANRFSNNIKTINVGGTDPNARSYGIGDHQLIITADLLQILITQFPNVEDLCFRNCGFDKDSVKLLNSYEGSVFSKLKHLGLNSVWCDGDAPPSMLMRFVHKDLETLSLQYLRIEQNVGDAILEALEREEAKLQNVDVTIANYFRVQSIEVQRYLRSLSRWTNKITVRLIGSYDERAPALVGAFQTAVELENLTGIYVDHFPLGRYENFDYDLAVQGLENVCRLSALSLNGWQDREILKSLVTSLTGAFLLESFCLRNLSETRNPEYSRDLDRLFSVLKVLHVDLSNIRDMNSNHLRTLCRKIPNLRTLRLAKVPRVSTHSVEQCLRKWPYLEALDIQTPLTATGVEALCSKRYLPKLKRASFWMQADQQKRSSMEKLLKSFERVDCWTNGAPDRYCRVSIRDRRPVELNTIPPNTVTYCHADHNPHYHEPLPPREQWDPSIPKRSFKWTNSTHHDSPRIFKIH